MKSNEEWFYRGTEGFLGKPDDCKLLFLMREPNCDKNEISQEDSFWFKKVVQKEKQPNGKKLAWSDCYLSKLGRIASLVLADNAGETESEWITALKKSIYMNINPISGEATKSNAYKDALDLFAKGPGVKCSLIVKEKEYNYPNRWNAILNMPDSSYIITVGDVYVKMHDWFEKQGEIISESTPCLCIKTKKNIQSKSMKSFVYNHNNCSVTVLETYHPAARGDNYYRWNDISFCK